MNASGQGNFVEEIGESNKRIAGKDKNISPAWRIFFKYVLTGGALLYLLYFAILLIVLRKQKSANDNAILSAVGDELCVTIDSGLNGLP